METLLRVECKRALLRLVRDGGLRGERIGRAYVYLAQHAGRRRQQRLRRQEHVDVLVGSQIHMLSHELQAAMILFFSFLDEQQRRLYAGLEAHKTGHGGHRRIADLLGLDEHTVAPGRREMFGGDVTRDRVRRAGGGRPGTGEKSRTSSPPSGD